jgi:phosphatidylglycerol:prolipoprotein diacylglycerol transferase
MNFLITLPEFDPVAFSLGPLDIRWYSLAYIAGIIFALFWIKKCNQEKSFLSEKAYDEWLTWAILSIIIGGRLGYVFFYNFEYFAKNPLEILAIWQGGMSFHGGLLGSIIGMWLFCKKYRVNYLQLTDCLAVAAPVGLFFGRLANFINLELYGRATGSDYGVIFPNAGNLPRHPSQLYEAALEGVLMFAILFTLKNRLKNSPGKLSGIFLICYGCFRVIVENFREPDQQIGFFFDKITLGQLLSLPLFLCGIYLLFFKKICKKS